MRDGFKARPGNAVLLLPRQGMLAGLDLDERDEPGAALMHKGLQVQRSLGIRRELRAEPAKARRLRGAALMCEGGW